MKTAVVILNWNGRSYLERFLPALVDSVEFRNGGENTRKECGEGMQTGDQTEMMMGMREEEYRRKWERGKSGEGERSEVIVADNASGDGSVEWLRENFPQVRTIVFDRNYGYTGGYNRALEQVDAEYYLLINSDIEVERGWLEPLESWMDSHPDCGACAPKLLSYNERNKFEYAGAAGGLIDRYGYPFCRGRVMRRTEMDGGQYDEPAYVFWVSGACLCVRAELFRKIGGFDQRFFAHQEEIDLCWRMQLEGYKVTVVPKSKVYHVGGGTLPNDSPWKLELNYRNNLLMLDNNLALTNTINYLKYRLYVKGDKFHKGGWKAEKALYKSVEKAAKKGWKRARNTIYARMFFDGVSAIAYLLSFRPKFFSAVIRAHQQFHRMRKHEGRIRIMDSLHRYISAGLGSQNNGFPASSSAENMRNDGFTRGLSVESMRTSLPTIEGVFPRSIICQHFWRGKHIFGYLQWGRYVPYFDKKKYY